MIETPPFTIIALLAFLGSFVGICALRPAATRLKLVDVASALKHHEGHIPLVGGMSILVGYLLAAAVFPILFSANAVFIVASVFLVVVGALDDRFFLGPMLRLVVQIAVSLIAIYGAGLVVQNVGAPFFTGVIEMGWLAVPFAVLVFVGGINAWNMIDGIDGLAATLAFIGLTCMLIVSGGAPDHVQASILVLLCGISAFIPFNLPIHSLRSKLTFLGDAGSMFLGFAIVWHALTLSQGASAAISPIIALWFVALPVFDVLTTTLRRVLRGQSPLSGDREHLHHLLQNAGLSSRQTLIAMAALAVTGGTVGLVGHFAAVSDSLMFTLFAVCVVAYFIGVRRLAKRSTQSAALAETQRVTAG